MFDHHLNWIKKELFGNNF